MKIRLAVFGSLFLGLLPTHFSFAEPVKAVGCQVALQAYFDFLAQVKQGHFRKIQVTLSSHQARRNDSGLDYVEPLVTYSRGEFFLPTPKWDVALSALYSDNLAAGPDGAPLFDYRYSNDKRGWSARFSPEFAGAERLTLEQNGKLTLNQVPYLLSCFNNGVQFFQTEKGIVTLSIQALEGIN